MTGHGAAHGRQAEWDVAVDVRAINSRYYKLSLRSTDGYQWLEPHVDEAVRSRIRRGTVQVDIRVTRSVTPDDFRVNMVVLESYQRQLEVWQGRRGSLHPVSIDALLTLPGVIEERGSLNIDAERDWSFIEPVLNEALSGLAQMRRREGEAMGDDLSENLAAIAGRLDHIDRLAPRVVENYRTRLTDRLNKLLEEHGVQVEPADVVREVGLFSERCDISEELVRLRSHLDQFRNIMRADESNGRKLEFITQEMFRETNTIGSKANDAEVAQQVVEIKSAMERIREMIQNIE